MEHQELGWLCLVALFLASLLIVLGWLLQYLLTFLRLRRARKTAGQVGGEPSQGLLSFTLPHQSLTGAVWGFLLKFRKGRPACEAGVKGLLTSLFSFKSIREHWQRTWVNALNEQACRHGVSHKHWVCHRSIIAYGGSVRQSTSDVTPSKARIF